MLQVFFLPLNLAPDEENFFNNFHFSQRETQFSSCERWKKVKKHFFFHWNAKIKETEKRPWDSFVRVFNFQQLLIVYLGSWRKNRKNNEKKRIIKKPEIFKRDVKWFVICSMEEKRQQQKKRKWLSTSERIRQGKWLLFCVWYIHEKTKNEECDLWTTWESVITVNLS